MKKLSIIFIAALSSCTSSQLNQGISTVGKVDSVAIVVANIVHKYDSIAKAHQSQLDSLTSKLSKVEAKQK